MCGQTLTLGTREAALFLHAVRKVVRLNSRVLYYWSEARLVRHSLFQNDLGSGL